MTLRERVCEYVLQHPGHTSTEIAAGVKARAADVRQILADGLTFTGAPRGLHPSDGGQAFYLAGYAPDGPGQAHAGRSKRPSQCDLIHAVLRDGRYHTAAEIHQRCGYSRLNSRIAELRSRRGLNIVCEHVPGKGSGTDAYRYRLLVGMPGEAVGGGRAASASPDTPAADPSSRPVREALRVPAGVSDPAQMTIGEAA